MDLPTGTGIIAAVATASALENLPAHGSLTRPSMVSIGTIVWLSSELMFFSALFAMYFTIRSVIGADNWPPEDVHLNIPLSLSVTVVLVLSSVTCQMGVFAAERGNREGLQRWFWITFFMGAFFVGGQIYEYSQLIDEGMTISAHAYGSMFYLTTGFHALHVTGGLVAFVLFLLRSKVGPFTPAQATSAIVVSYYWHFVDIVWIALWGTIYVLQ